jgi:hypothetical protein
MNLSLNDNKTSHDVVRIDDDLTVACGAVQLNCIGVKVPSPIVRYIASTPDAAAAPNPLTPAVKWLLVGPVRHCSPHHRTSFNSIKEGSECVG